MAPKVLLLHGYLQNGILMEEKFRKILHNYELICPTGPWVIDSTRNQRGWWNLPSKEMFVKPHSYEGIDEAIELLGNVGTVDFVIGFSQGAVFASILISKGIITPKKAILISASDIMDSKWMISDEEKLTTPTLMIVGASDSLCPKEQSESLAKRFSEVTFYIHKLGHVIPNKSLDKKKYCDFLQ